MGRRARGYTDGRLQHRHEEEGEWLQGKNATGHHIENLLKGLVAADDGEDLPVEVQNSARKRRRFYNRLKVNGELTSKASLEEAVINLEGKIKQVMEKVAPMKTLEKKRKRSRWLSQELKPVM